MYYLFQGYRSVIRQSYTIHSVRAAFLAGNKYPLETLFKNEIKWGIWMAQSGEHWTLSFGSCPALMGCGLQPHRWALCSVQRLLEILSPCPFLLTLQLSLSLYTSLRIFLDILYYINSTSPLFFPLL